MTALTTVLGRYAEIARYGVGDQWTEQAKARRLVDLMATAQSSVAQVFVVREIFDHGYPATVYEEQFQRLHQLSSSDVGEAFATRIHPDKLQVVVVADPRVRDQLDSMGAVLTRTPGDLVNTG